MSSVPQQSMQEIYNDVAALVNDYNELEADVTNKNYKNIAVIQADIQKQQGSLENLMMGLTTYQNQLPVGSNAYQALSQVTASLFQCVEQLTTVISDINNPGSNNTGYANALAALSNQGGPGAGVINLAVEAYRQTLDWSAAVVQDDISNGASVSQIKQDLIAFQTILSSESPSNMAGALGLSTQTFTKLTAAVAQAITDVAQPKALQSDWTSILQILDSIPMVVRDKGTQENPSA